MFQLFSCSPIFLKNTHKNALAFFVACALLGSFFTWSAAQAQTEVQNYPSWPVTLVVPFTSGSGSDTIARIISPKLSERWKQAVIVDNRPGASGNLGTDKVAKSAPDGLTLLMAIDTITMTPSIYKSLPYDPLKDLVPIARLAVASYGLAINNEVPAKDLNSLFALIKSKPGKLNYASPGSGTPHHLSMELLKNLKGLDLVHVPYKGLSGAQTDLIGGQVQVMIATFNSLLPYAKANKLKMLAVTGSKRSELMPEIPTFTEQSMPEFENLFPWYAVLAPAGTPKEIQAKLFKDFTEVMELEDVKKQLKDQGIFVNILNADQLNTLMRSDMQRWKNVVTQAHITQD
jgi:tripartite-type tricarboxylate transporter receptor subunit TctC